MEKMIFGAQRSKIFALARELNMSTHSKEKDDDLHLLIDGIVGKESITQLTSADADKVIAELAHRQRFAPRHCSPVAEKPGGVSIGQQKKIIALMCELRKFDEVSSKATIEQRVAGIIRWKLKISVTEQDPYAWLTYRHGVKLIETIKGLLETAQRKAKAKGGAG